jgi:glycosyltransferase involved in cell wall biosynthesis
LNALADAMQRLLSDPSRRAELGRAARETVVSAFAPAKEIERNLEIYQHVMRKT